MKKILLIALAFSYSQLQAFAFDYNLAFANQGSYCNGYIKAIESVNPSYRGQVMACNGSIASDFCHGYNDGAQAVGFSGPLAACPN